jgi:hypothetical protein
VIDRRFRTPIVLIALLLAPAAATAQDGLRSASLPERPIAVQPPGPADLFRARPGTYAPPPPPRRLYRQSSFFPGLYGGAFGVYGGDVQAAIPTGYLQLQVRPFDAQVFVDGFFVGSVDDVRRAGGALPAGPHRIELRAPGYQTRTFDVRIAANETTTYRYELEPEAEPLRLPQSRPPAGAAAPPKTFYVIAGCYAGDKPPEAARLPPGCDMSRVKAIPPVR